MAAWVVAQVDPLVGLVPVVLLVLVLVLLVKVVLVLLGLFLGWWT